MKHVAWYYEDTPTPYYHIYGVTKERICSTYLRVLESIHGSNY